MHRDSGILVCRMQLAVSVQLPREVGGLAGEAIYLGMHSLLAGVYCNVARVLPDTDPLYTVCDGEPILSSCVKVRRHRGRL